MNPLRATRQHLAQVLRACHCVRRQGEGKIVLSYPLLCSSRYTNTHIHGSMGLHSACCRALNRDDVDIEKLSALANIELTENEKIDLGADIERIVDWFGELQELDVSDVDPSLRSGVSDSCGDASSLREDVVSLDPERAKQMLGQVPDQRLSGDGFVQVPKR